MPELLARRHRSLVRRLPAAGGVLRYEADGLSLDFLRRSVTVDGVPRALSPLEYRLLCLLAGQEGCVPYEELLIALWGRADPRAGASLRYLAACLRRKLDPSAPCRFVRTCIGSGYSLPPQAPRPPDGGESSGSR